MSESTASSSKSTADIIEPRTYQLNNKNKTQYQQKGNNTTSTRKSCIHCNKQGHQYYRDNTINNRISKQNRTSTDFTYKSTGKTYWKDRKPKSEINDPDDWENHYY